jgi:hypothetical protein
MSGRTSRALGETPRIWTFASEPDEASGKAPITRTSALTSASPDWERATPGASASTRAWSSITTLIISAFAPPLRMSAFCGDPEVTSVERNPWAIASITMKTPTVPAMLKTATSVDGQRLTMLFTL